MDLHPFLLIVELREAAATLESMLLDRLAGEGWPPLTANQVFTIAHVGEQGATPAELARRMSMSRQSMQKNLERLAEMGLIVVESHPTDRRSRLVELTADGLLFSRDAGAIVDGFERRLEASLGTGTVNAARTVLRTNWIELLETVRTPGEAQPARLD